MIESLNSLSEDELIRIDVSPAKYSTEIVELEGVVSAESQSGSSRGEFAVHMFSFAAWGKVLNNQIIENKLLILRPVNSSKDYFKDIQEYSILRLSVYLNSVQTRAIFLKGEKLEKSDNPALDSLVAELKKPIEMETEYFGKLVFDKSIEWFAGTKEWNEEQINLHFSTNENREINKGLMTAEKVWKEIEIWDNRVKQFAVKELLETKNDAWIENEDEKVTEDQFKNLMKLNAINFDPEGNFEFYYDDGDLFWGHEIYSSGNLTEGITDIAF